MQLVPVAVASAQGISGSHQCHGRQLLPCLQVMEEDGAVLACAVNAACVALVNAGVPLRSTFGEGHACLIPRHTSSVPVADHRNSACLLFSHHTPTPRAPAACTACSVKDGALLLDPEASEEQVGAAPLHNHQAVSALACLNARG
jgi:ribonuclease PH